MIKIVLLKIITMIFVTPFVIRTLVRCEPSYGSMRLHDNHVGPEKKKYEPHHIILAP